MYLSLMPWLVLTLSLCSDISVPAPEFWKIPSVSNSWAAGMAKIHRDSRCERIWGHKIHQSRVCNVFANENDQSSQINRPTNVFFTVMGQLFAKTKFWITQCPYSIPLSMSTDKHKRTKRVQEWGVGFVINTLRTRRTLVLTSRQQ